MVDTLGVEGGSPNFWIPAFAGMTRLYSCWRDGLRYLRSVGFVQVVSGVRRNFVACAASVADLDEAAFRNQVGQFPVGRRPAGLGQAGVLARVYAAFEAASAGVEQAVEGFALAFVERRSLMAEPEAGLGDDSLDGGFRAVAGRGDFDEEPSEPRGDVEAAALGCFERVVIRFAVTHDLGGEREHAQRLAFVLAERHVGDGAREAAVAVLERV